ncbi:IS5 family transposase [Candidatus Methylospira mobilis]|uniref:IS5 family transposase n=1 Tax=Candidatus Methylospira mobilis TaxID=1808979 RepID=A0A5Q0BNH9_9GAMM|nr:IS5 family transposase [Candidatus Methylospira mobilis]QFY43791.1 IS5 family transposase [Candidatus Methylospira mobilis]WNV04780.1 IS5 family transposase [Candidatus Methylospira mobilis]
MADRLDISAEDCNVIYPILVKHRHVRSTSEEQCQAFLVAVLQILRSGSQCCSLPEAHGKWNAVFKRFSRWSKHGVWRSLFAGCIHHPDLQSVFIDSTINRAHPCVGGAAGGNAGDEALGRSKGGFGTKIHAITDALGNSLEFVLTGGQASDIGQAETLPALTPSGCACVCRRQRL